ncbi:hypothetical protein CAPTEDRAFT_18029 [Capitella teleta]|uniref:Uncharacterized protein n=1 Tax=Capitella teleta TaxID=283909 RepID=R7UDN4_CAPTE|nr:hypothetical protein CAPTEDRAFT_18029 [Capitella teleta]|eukprot:ELU04221.1 hypothetical protein CAPTEDRAFT_18029 [Capitella teleta]
MEPGSGSATSTVEPTEYIGTLRPNYGKLLAVSSDFAAGLLGGCAGLVFGHPFDTIKVLQQTSSGSFRPSIVQCAKKTLKHEGPRGFFKGMAFPLASVGLLNSIFFGIYGNAIKVLNNYRHDDPHAEPFYSDIFIAGAIAGGIQGIPATPIELVKVKLQAQTAKSSYNGPIHCLHQIYRCHGIRGCFRGLGATAMREVPGFSVYITSYQFFCDKLCDADNRANPSFRASLFAGGFAGVTSWVTNIPIDVIKSRLQADSMSNPKYRGFIDCAVQMYRQEGIRIFWRGLPVTCLRAFPLNAITLGVYSSSLQVMRKRAAELQDC